MPGSPTSPRQSRQSQQTTSSSRRQSIPLQDLWPQQGQQQHESREPGSLADRNLPTISTYWEGSQFQHEHHDDYELSPSSPFDASALQFALPPDIRPPQLAAPRSTSASTNPYITQTPYYEEAPQDDYFDSDRAPLTSSAQPIAGTPLAAPQPESQPRDSFQTVSDIDNSPRPRGRSTQLLGFGLENGQDRARHRSYGNSLIPADHRVSRIQGTTDALHRAGSIVRAMSQRVVNISGEGESIEQRQQRSRSPSVDGRRPSFSHRSSQIGIDTSYTSQVYPSSPIEKRGEPDWMVSEPPPPPRRAGPMPNPLKGRSLGIFPPDSVIRRKLCDILVNPYLEPTLLVLIVLQAILLAVEAANNVYEPGYGRKPLWAPSSAINWAILVLFIIFTIEIVARVIVSGFIINAAEYSTNDGKRGIRNAISDQYNAVFRPQRHKSVHVPRQEGYGPSTFARSFTMMHAMPETVEEQMRLHLARRAFLRHSFNRLDFVAVVSFWIAFGLSITGLETKYHLYIFRMLSCLRIIRLLALTNGTAIILRSLQKAAPLLLRVSFLIGFFWLLFAIVGVQSFKSSLSRQCVWLDPMDPKNFTAAYTNDMTFCGGYIHNTTLKPVPWVKLAEPDSLDNLTSALGDAKGFICPQHSICLEQQSPFNGTVSFDNIIQSLELVFVIMSANTWSDIMYYTTNSDYQTAALFFGAGIMILMLWLTNLLIAVITSSFQVIREESKASAFTADQDPLLTALQEPQLQRVSTLQRIYDKTSVIWVLLIAYEIFAQGWQSSNMTQAREDFIKVSTILVTALLDIEIAIRIVANWRSFHRNTRNLVDLFLAVANTVILLPPVRTSGQTYAWLTIFQILRVYRVVLAIPITRDLILLVLGNATGIGNLIIFVFLITFIMAIFAVQLFRGEIPLYDDSGNLIQVSFYNIFNSFLGMYQILSSENWTSILYTVTGQSNSRNTAWYGAVFLIGWFILAFFILVNMFIAVIQENFDVSEDEKRLEQVKAFLQRKELGSTAGSNVALSEIFSFGKQRQRRDPLDYGPATMEMLLKDAVVREFLDDPLDPLHQQTPTDSETPLHEAIGTEKRSRLVSPIWRKIQKTIGNQEPNPFYSNIQFNGPNAALDPRQMARQAMSATLERRKAQREYLKRHPTYNNALYIFTPQNPIRRLCQRIVGPGRGSERFNGVEPNMIVWYSFSVFIYAAIIAMVVIAGVTTPLYQKLYLEANKLTEDNRSTSWFVWVDFAFAVLFTVEAVIKIIADGLFFTPNAYYRSSWGFIDAVVLITLWINVLTLILNDGSVSRVVGAFKALRALRLLNISNTARDTFHSLIIVAGWKIVSAALVSLSLLIPFAIYALNLFSGQLLSCNDSNLSSLQDCFGEYQSSPSNSNWPLLAPRVAENPFFSFDDFAASLFILFQIVSQEGWVDVSFAVQSITGHGLQPRPMASRGNALFFVVFNLLGTVFVLTLFISVFMRNYTEQTGVAFLTAEQRTWLELRKLLRQISPSRSSYDESEKRWKKWCHKRAIEKRGKWYTAITIVLVLHLTLLLLEYYPEPEWWSRTRDLIFLLFTLIYIANIVIRIVGLGWTRFRRSSWDVFSLIAVFGAFATALLLIKQNGQAFMQLHKGFLVGIVLLLIPRNDALDQLFKTAAASLTTIINLLATWLVFFVVFAIALTQTFSLTRFGPLENNYVNFRNVPNALILLFRMSVGEGWNAIMEDFAQIRRPLCVEGAGFFDSDCGDISWARALFIAWNLISMYIFVNLFISLIYESFSYVYQRSSGMAHIDRDEIRRFKEAWRSVDPAGTGFITKEAFPRLLGELSGVFEMRIYEPEDSVSRILEDVRGNGQGPGRHTSIATTSDLSGVDIQKLNERLALIDIEKVRERRRRYNIFYGEVMVSADPDRGISFTTVLMIMAHYNIISDSKSLRLEEFLRRRARLQRVEEEVNRRIVLGFFDTLYYSRRFRRHMDKKRSGRMTAIPQLDVPEILVDDESDRARARARAVHQRTTLAAPPTPAASSDFLSVADATRQHRSWSLGADISTYDATQPHPLSAPRAAPVVSEDRAETSAYSFDVQENTTSNTRDRQGSDVSPAQLRSFLDDSVWAESIRRSATVRKSVRRSDWMGRR